MRYLAALSLATLASSIPCWLQAAPANDNITNATPLDANKTFHRLVGELNGVTADELPLLFPGDTLPTTYALPEIWFKWTAPIDGKVAIQAAGSNVVVWGVTLLGPAVQNVYPVVAFDFLSSSYGSSNVWLTTYTFDVEAGKTYFNALWTDNMEPSNAYTYVHRFVQGAISDDFATRTQLGGVDFTIKGNNSSFGAEEGEPDHASNSTTSVDRSAWMTWSSPEFRKTVTITVNSTVFEPIVAIYTGDSLDGLTRVARGTVSSNRDGNTSTVTFIAEDGADYHIAVDGSKARAGAFTLSLKANTVRPGFAVQPLAATVEQGTVATFSAVASYTGDTVSYQWERQAAGEKTWTPLTADDATFTGVQTSELSIYTVLEMNKDRYRVKATDIVGTSTSRAALLTVTEFPALATEVLGTNNFDIGQGEVPMPTNGGTYFATGLPRGLSLDPETGIISGIADGRPGTYRVLYGSTDGKKRNPEQFILQIIVAPFSPPLTGSFEALLNDPVTSLPAGKLSLKVAKNGRYTGSYFELATSRTYKFRGTFSLNQASRTAHTPDEEPIKLSRGKDLPPFNLTLSLAEPPAETMDSFTVVSAAISDAEDILLAQVDDGAPISRFTALNPAPWASNYTLRFTAPVSLGDDPDLALPVGSGYATGTVVTRTGALKLRGRLPDNSRFTANLASSPSGTYRLAQKIHGPGGSLAGRINLSEATSTDLLTTYHVGSEDDAKAYWVKPARPRDRLYPAGFGTSPVAFTLLMEPWVNPAGNFPSALGLAEAGDMKVNIVAVEPQDSNDALTDQNNIYALPIDVRINAVGKLSYVNPAVNATKFSMRINSKSGAFSGSYVLAEPPVPPSARSSKTRKVTFSGVMFQPTSTFFGDVIGDGFAIVPPFSSEETTTSALIDFRAGEPESVFEIGQDL